MTDKKGQHKASPINDSSIIAQQRTVLEALRPAPAGCTTIELREGHNIMHPAGRVKELRERGFNILTVWDYTENAQGHKHRNARYVLLAGNYQGGAA